ncbi:hypothetical protein TcWFU_010469 [Taenia crassiceps]|uniref:Btz domain-containing protein n=1 Tax=Taenia crassiceps TaxID=6207 RepID=A0ABR4QN31_9CEST
MINLFAIGCQIWTSLIARSFHLSSPHEEELSHQPFDWPDDTDSSVSPERVICGEHDRARGAPNCPLSPVPPTRPDSPPCLRDSCSTVKRDGRPMSPSQQNLYFPAGSGWLRNYKSDRKSCKKKCVAKNTITAEDSSLCVPKNVCATKCDFQTTSMDGRNSVNPSTQVCSASERDGAVDSAPIICKVDGAAANAPMVAHENKTPISEMLRGIIIRSRQWEALLSFNNSKMDEVLASATVEISSAVPAVPVPSVPTQNAASQPDVSEASKGVVSAPGRVRRRSTSSRSSRSLRFRRDRSHSSSPSSDRYYRRGRHHRSRSRNQSRTRSRSRSSRFRHRRRSSRTPSYRPPRRRQYGRLRRFSPPRPYRGSRGAPYVSTFPRRDSRSPLRGAGGPAQLPQRPTRMLPPSTATKTMGSGGGSPLAGRIPPLNERFEGLLEATLRQRRREYGVPGGLAYLILTNRLKLPLPTLMREAKELSVVIERNLPPEVADPTAEISFNVDLGVNFVFPHPPNAGTKPVFDREEIPIFSKPEDLEKITERAAASLAVIAANRMGSQPPTSTYGEVDSNNNGSANNLDRSDRLRRGASNPLDVPKGSAYFMHDDRDGRPYGWRRRDFNEPYSRENWRQRRLDYEYRENEGYQGGNRRWAQRPDEERGDRAVGGGRRWGYRSMRHGGREEVEEARWCHDKFLELEGETNNGDAGASRHSSPSTTNSHPIRREPN